MMIRRLLEEFGVRENDDGCSYYLKGPVCCDVTELHIPPDCATKQPSSVMGVVKWKAVEESVAYSSRAP